MEALWLTEVICCDKELQHPYCAALLVDLKCCIRKSESLSTMIPISGGGTTPISKWHRAGTNQVVVVIETCRGLVCCQGKTLFISICKRQDLV